MKTFHQKPEDVVRDWYEIDAAGKTVGRLATHVARLLTGKHKPTYSPHIDGGDFVIITNADKVVFSGNKLAQKKYYRHSGYPGGLKEATAGQLLEKHPDRILRSAINGMLAKNRLRADRMKRLKVYTSATHDHQAQKPSKIDV